MADNFDPDAYLASLEAQPQDVQAEPQVLSGLEPEAFDPDKYLKEQRAEEFGGLGQQAITALEGAGEGVLGPLAPMIEKGLGVDPEGILARREENPISHGVGQVGGLTAGLLTKTGAANVMTKAGALAERAILGETAQALTYGHRVGSAIVREAVENAVLQGSDEVAKMVLKDPDASAESAIANVGLAAALGGAGGALFAGAVNPLWTATAGPKVEKLLTNLKGHLDGQAVVLPEAVASAEKDLGIELTPVMKAALSGDERAAKEFVTLTYGQNKHVLDSIQKTQDEVSESVMRGLGVPLEDVKVGSRKETGESIIDKFKKEIEEKYGPQAEAMDAMNKRSETIALPDETRLKLYDKLLTDGMQKVGTNFPEFKLYEQWGEHLLARADNVKQLDELMTRLRNDIDAASQFGNKDKNKTLALQDIRQSIREFREEQILKQGKQVEKDGAEFGSAIAKDIVKEDLATKASYAEYAKINDQLLDHLGAGEFQGTKSMLKRLASYTPEEIAKKFSVKGDATFIDLLKKSFPDTLEEIRKKELIDLIRPSVNSAKGESPINLNQLSKTIKKVLSEQKELAEFALPKDALRKIEAGETLLAAIPRSKDSGTPGGVSRLFSKLPASAMAAVALVSGNNPLVGYLVGEMAQKLGRDIPDQIRLGYLAFLGSDKPVKAEGFKAMVDFLHNAARGENLFSKATKNVFVSGARVLAGAQIPDQKSREKLDKVVTNMEKAPDKMFGLGTGDVGHYMPSHQASLARAGATAVQYLQSIKPRPVQLSPLDRPIEPTAAQKARYDRALDIAQQPAVVLQRIKDGTLQVTDIQDLKAMYPAVFNRMAAKLSNDLAIRHADDEIIPYKTKIAVSLFLASPLDSTMKPQNIVAAQPKPVVQQPVKPTQGHGKSMKSLGKTNKMYQTPLQASEAEDASRGGTE